jgi:arylsulfatase A-like enzyme
MKRIIDRQLPRIKTGLVLMVATGSVFLLIHSCHVDSGSGSLPYNVLFLSVDDMNNYGFYDEYPGVRMPHLDDFKESAVTFQHAYCASPVCTPSRAAIYSGMYPHTTGGYYNGSDPWRKSDLLIQCETMPECFKRHGYFSWGRGKIYHAKLEKGREALNFDNRPLWGGGFGPYPDSLHQIKGRFWGIQAFPDSLFPDVINSDEAIKFLMEEHQEPFYMSLGLWRPHTPFTCPQRFYELYDIEDIKLPPGYLVNDVADIPDEAKRLLDPFKRFNPENETEWKELVRAYLACTSFADWNIGRVIEALDNSLYAENTIVVFWSDNGYHCGEKDHWEKNTLWEQASRVPLAIRIPGNRKNGRVCLEPVNLVDLYPTLADYCELEVRKDQLEGISLRKFLKKPGREFGSTALTTFGEGFAGVKDRRYRYIVYGDGSEELYDHRTDPWELDNLADDPEYNDIKAGLKRKIPVKFARALKGRRS